MSCCLIATRPAANRRLANVSRVRHTERHGADGARTHGSGQNNARPPGTDERPGYRDGSEEVQGLHTTTPRQMINFDHQPGEPYLLTREQFIQFLGQAETYQQLLAGFAGPGAHRAEQRAFWATLAAFEASREFNPLEGGCCGSDLIMDTHDNQATMAWAYQTTSGTLIEAIEPRECGTEPDMGYPGVRCGDLPAPTFRVTIPEDRDQPGRYHWKQLRQGGTYCD